MSLPILPPIDEPEIGLTVIAACVPIIEPYKIAIEYRRLGNRLGTVAGRLKFKFC
jgi:hypothetical protein